MRLQSLSSANRGDVTSFPLKHRGMCSLGVTLCSEPLKNNNYWQKLSKSLQAAGFSGPGLRKKRVIHRHGPQKKPFYSVCEWNRWRNRNSSKKCPTQETIVEASTSEGDYEKALTAF
ncbi:hypothetical protein RRG08_026252 [Elysia crispata]|uniref:Uncharacterized protein n=1 Tax=Elysia crispata TaxID=231223 RepID=A0AAE1DCT1_9GAST|nr:hypothetical protein RRG08_026252 [Elysia crispata]